jgi:septal ring factor EnvC (AmiA/AmiB activator)
MTTNMCDQELLLGYLYGELPGTERDAFERHLKSCTDCRTEVDGLRTTRTYLESWTPPEPDLGFQVVRGPQASRPSARWWGLSPAWGLAAAAMLVGGISAAIANVEVTTAADGITVRTGWNRTAEPQGQVSAQNPQARTDAQRVAALEARLRELETQIASVRSAPPATPTNAVASRMSDAEMVRLVRQLIEQSEERQQGVLARQILQVNRDVETARRTDFDRLGRGMVEIQRTAVEAYQRQRAIEDHLARVGLQR